MRVRFPLKGIHKGFGTVNQPQDTTPDSLDKWGNGDQIGDIEQPVVAMVVIGALR